MKPLWLAVVIVFSLLAACDTASSPPGGLEAQTLTPAPERYADNPKCRDLLGDDYVELKVDPGVSGTFTNGYLSVTIAVTETPAGPTFDFTSDRLVDVVLAKGGRNSGDGGGNLYDYRPAATLEGDELHAPVNPSGFWADLSHISFCYQLRLDVTKTAKATVKRTWSWDVAKTASETALTLRQGQSYGVNYGVTVSAASADRDRTVTGTITATNATGVAATVTGVSDLLGSVSVVPDCGVTINPVAPYTLAAGGTLTCTYSYMNDDSTVLPGTGVNTATVMTSGQVKGGVATAPWDFAASTLSAELDECVSLTDTLEGDLGTVCAADLVNGSKTFAYALDMKDYATECGENVVANTATTTTNDGQIVNSASHTVAVTVDCVTGCTLTQGYWKTHSSYGPARYDETWALVGAGVGAGIGSGTGADTPFYRSGKSYYGVLWTPPAGSAYYVLAHQFIAATLNVLAEADETVVAQDLATARAFFASTAPTTVLSKTQQAGLKALAGRLDAYNNGATGPGHCDE